MDILITETQEVKTLKIETDPTDSLIGIYSGNAEFKSIDDSFDGWVGDAEYEMSQEDFDWWDEVVDNYNKADALEAEYKEKYGNDVVNAVLEEYFCPSEIGEDGTDRILALEGYFKNDGWVYHTLYNIDFLDNENGFEDCQDGSYNFSVVVTVDNVLIPGSIKLGYTPKFNNTNIELNIDGFYAPNEDFEIKDYVWSNCKNLSETIMSYEDVQSYASDIADCSKTPEGLTLDEAIKELIDTRIASK